MPPDAHEPDARARLIETIRTPLGFFALVILVTEALLGVAATLLREDVDPVYVLAAMAALILLLIVIVTGFALFRPEALHGRRAERLTPASAGPGPGTELVRGPHILCASTVGSSAQELERYAELLSRHFADVTVRRDLGSDALRSALTEKPYHLVHLVMQATAGGQQLAAGDVAGLFDSSSVRVVVLTACDSLPAAAEVARVASIIVAPTTVGRGEVIRWSDNFYERLAGGLALSDAYGAASGASRAPVMLMLTKDVAFSR